MPFDLDGTRQRPPTKARRTRAIAVPAVAEIGRYITHRFETPRPALAPRSDVMERVGSDIRTTTLLDLLQRYIPT